MKKKILSGCALVFSMLAALAQTPPVPVNHDFDFWLDRSGFISHEGTQRSQKTMEGPVSPFGKLRTQSLSSG
jgi:hypothetical protein